ncbi:hypothetical protein PUV54_11305 [Hyphococcus flavus]|uniref:Uncharacterized protein n=1 Tax=Hyphococcus flavus TaxID=1866326 RepID=A0AAE9ZDB5_9PROT|nr:hypothetical protein [Hyphococcus flavus]WDI30543.1 hypothetical protein PUV54_11305 [Hyphococcus flavus]
MPVNERTFVPTHIVDLANEDEQLKNTLFEWLKGADNWYSRKLNALNPDHPQFAVYTTHKEYYNALELRLKGNHQSSYKALLADLISHLDKPKSESEINNAKAAVIICALGIYLQFKRYQDLIENKQDDRKKFTYELKKIERRYAKLLSDYNKLLTAYAETIRIPKDQLNRLTPYRAFPFERLKDMYSNPRGAQKDERLRIVVEYAAEMFGAYSTKSLKTKGGSFERFAQYMMHLVTESPVKETGLQKTITRLKSDKDYRAEVAEVNRVWEQNEQSRKDKLAAAGFDVDERDTANKSYFDEKTGLRLRPISKPSVSRFKS